MALTIAEIMSKVPEAFVPEKAAGVSAVVHFKFTGAEAGEWNAVIRDGKCEVAQGIPHARPTITITVDSEDYKRMLAGQMDAAAAFMAGKLKVQGDADLAMRLTKMFMMK